MGYVVSVKPGPFPAGDGPLLCFIHCFIHVCRFLLSIWPVVYFGQVAELVQTARVQRGPSEAARCASNRRMPLGRCYFIPAILLADSTVLSSNIAIVIGPTPPGTGLIHPAFWLTGS